MPCTILFSFSYFGAEYSEHFHFIYFYSTFNECGKFCYIFYWLQPLSVSSYCPIISFIYPFFPFAFPHSQYYAQVTYWNEFSFRLISMKTYGIEIERDKKKETMKNNKEQCQEDESVCLSSWCICSSFWWLLI